MKPSLTSCCFSTSSLYRFRISISDDMSISLNVVRNAAVFCDSFNRSAMRSRIRLIFTRFSFREKLTEAAVATEGVGCCLPSFFAAGAGLLVSLTSTLLGWAGGGDGCSLGAAFGSASCGGAASDDAAAEEAEDPSGSPGAMRKRSCPTVTVSSSFASSSVILPAAGALTDTSICRGERMDPCQLVLPHFRWTELIDILNERKIRNPKPRCRMGEVEERKKNKDVIGEMVVRYLPCRSR